MALTVILTVLLNLVLIQGRTEVGQQSAFVPDNQTHFDVYASALSRAHYSPWACSYRTEPGYKCLSCIKALHCYPGNFALLVQCAGFFPFCRNGYCSRYKTDGCIEEPVEGHTVTHSPVGPFGHKDNQTSTVPHDSVDQESGLTEVHEPILEASNVNAVATELNYPNKIISGIVTSTNTADTSDTSQIKEPRGN